MKISIVLDSNKCSPGETLSGTVAWFCDKAPENIILELLWETSGRGTTDSKVVYKEKIPCDDLKGEVNFSFVVPLECPPTYEGRMISISHKLKVSADIKWAIDPKIYESVIISPTHRPLLNIIGLNENYYDIADEIEEEMNDPQERK